MSKLRGEQCSMNHASGRPEVESLVCKVVMTGVKIEIRLVLPKLRANLLFTVLRMMLNGLFVP